MLLNYLRTIPQYLLPKHVMTLLAGVLAEVKNESVKNAVIQSFIRKFKVNMQEALHEDPKSYECFNDFFIRHLKPECRPIANSSIISPVDGKVSEIAEIHDGQLIQAKGKYYSVEELLGEETSFTQSFKQGRFTTLYLSPKDYHRIHMPIAGKLTRMKFIPGTLFSVQPTTVQVVPRLFVRNERLVLHFETAIGPMALVMVGAIIVGAMGTSWHGDIQRTKVSQEFNYSNKSLDKGEELGYFKLGSTVVLLFAEGHKMAWNNQLNAGSSIRFGDALGDLL